MHHPHVITLDHQKVGYFVICRCGYSQYAVRAGVAGALIMAHRLMVFPEVRRRLHSLAPQA